MEKDGMERYINIMIMVKLEFEKEYMKGKINGKVKIYYPYIYSIKLKE